MNEITTLLACVVHSTDRLFNMHDCFGCPSPSTVVALEVKRSSIYQDESKFNIFGSDGHIIVWRRKNEELNPKHLIGTGKHGDGGVLVWGCMSASGLGARKTNTLLIKEHQEAIKAMVAKQPPTPSRSSSEIDVSNEFTTPVKCKRTSKSPNKGKAKKAKPSEEVIALSNSFSAIAHLEVDVKDLNEDNVVDTAPGTEEEDSIPQAPVEDPCNIDMIDNEQESPDESPLAVDAGGHTSSSTKDTQPKTYPANCY
ncbi:uncharacterized protein TNCV_1039771 [Trichonephila clavipes]|nr:uncharacterized protein TNCV_1039771 [Trichonephila clavipes]